MPAIVEMNKPKLKVSVSDKDSSSDNIEDSENEEDKSNLTDDESSENNDKNILTANEGWADSLAKILSSDKPKNKKTLVLSRAKKYTETLKKVKEEKPAFEVVGEIKDEKQEIKKEISISTEPPPKKKRHEKSSIKVKPNILERDRERLLTKIATKGVVQLFNAVRNQQKSIDKEMNNDNISESKATKIRKKFDKRTFLDTLMGQTKSIVVDEEAKTLKKEMKAEDDKPKWNALRDDFMMGATMKDWDKESIEENT